MGENWQEEYYIWDCAAGTGNLLAGLTNKYNIYASTLDMADVNVMHERIDHGANLLKNHVFQFDFLNDDFFPSSGGVSEVRGGSKLPQSLQDIINDAEKRKKLIVYINPPYAEAGTGLGNLHKGGVALKNRTKEKYNKELGKASNELFTQFLVRMYFEIPNVKIAIFSKLKNLQSSNFIIFRSFFQSKIEKIFLAPADTFDNVKGKFPIGFSIFNSEIKEKFYFISADVFDKNVNFIGSKNLYSYDELKKGKINDWLRNHYDKKNSVIGIMHNNKTDFQHNSQVVITSFDNKDHTTPITFLNLIEMCIYLAMRHSIPATWLNDRDQFLYPNDGWQTDFDFQNDCLAFTLFQSQNRITSQEGVNHWIPFTEQEVNAQNRFESNFMTDFINGKIKIDNKTNLFGTIENLTFKREFSEEATAVFDAGRELWAYYHSQPNVNVNASFYDIREYFQGRNDKGRMNSKSDDATYTELISDLRNNLNFLADKIKPKIYEYEFLKE